MKAETVRLALACGTIVFLGAFFSCREIPSTETRALAAYPSDTRGVPEIRAVIARRPEGLRVSVNGRFDLLGGPARGARTGLGARNKSLAPVLVRGSGGGLAVGEQRLGHEAIEFRPYEKHEVDDEKCTRCGMCTLACQDDAIEVV